MKTHNARNSQFSAVDSACETAGKFNYKRTYKKMLVETIADLEATRKSFKSKQIETLRKKLITELSEIE